MTNEKVPSKARKAVIYTTDFMAEIAAHPITQALSKFKPLAGAIVSLFAGEYARRKQDEIIDVLHRLHSKVQSIDKKYIDNDFFNSEQGKRAFAIAYRSLIRDSREEKIKTMSTLLANLAVKTKLTYDERELYIDILDALNPFHLSVLGRIYEFYQEQKPNRRLFDPNGIADFFQDKGIDKQLTHQAIGVLANFYLVNRGTGASIGDGGLTYYFTDFGERFFNFISEVQQKSSPYLSL